LQIMFLRRWVFSIEFPASAPLDPFPKNGHGNRTKVQVLASTSQGTFQVNSYISGPELGVL
jgi:hypothetical protein